MELNFTLKSLVSAKKKKKTSKRPLRSMTRMLPDQMPFIQVNPSRVLGHLQGNWAGAQIWWPSQKLGRRCPRRVSGNLPWRPGGSSPNPSSPSSRRGHPGWLGPAALQPRVRRWRCAPAGHARSLGSAAGGRILPSAPAPTAWGQRDCPLLHCPICQGPVSNK